jgi:hypothetical protein
MKHFKNTLNEISEVQAYLLEIEKLGIDEGIAPEFVSLTNATQRIKKRLQILRDMEKKAELLGYSSLPSAIKALKQFKPILVISEERSKWLEENTPIGTMP